MKTDFAIAITVSCFAFQFAQGQSSPIKETDLKILSISIDGKNIVKNGTIEIVQTPTILGSSDNNITTKKTVSDLNLKLLAIDIA
jgi:hypothetical protein